MTGVPLWGTGGNRLAESTDEAIEVVVGFLLLESFAHVRAALIELFGLGRANSTFTIPCEMNVADSKSEYHILESFFFLKKSAEALPFNKKKRITTYFLQVSKGGEKIQSHSVRFVLGHVCRLCFPM